MYIFIRRGGGEGIAKRKDKDKGIINYRYTL